MAAVLSVKDFDILMRGLEREIAKNPNPKLIIDVTGRHLSHFLNGDSSTQVFVVIHSDNLNVSVGASGMMSIKRPGFFNKERKVYDNAMTILKKLMDKGTTEIEKELVRCIPSTQDIIAEKALVGDHGN